MLEFFEQGYRSLETSDGFCCLGVACKILIKSPYTEEYTDYDLEYEELKGWYPGDQKDSPDWLKGIDKVFKIETGSKLSFLNDGEDVFRTHTHKEISKFIRGVFILNKKYKVSGDTLKEIV